MPSKETAKAKPGRPRKDDSKKLRLNTFELLWSASQDAGSEPVLVTYRELAEKLSIDLRTARVVLSDLQYFGTQIKFAQDGVHLGSIAYYHTNLAIASSQKDGIADSFVRVIPPNVTLACSCGTTVTRCARRLFENSQYHVIVTNNIGVIDELNDTNSGNLVFSGGHYHRGFHGCVGESAIATFQNAKCEAALIGVSGINEQGELFVRHDQEIPVLYQILASVQRLVYVVADARKLTLEDTWRFIRLSDLLQDEQRPDLKIKIITSPEDTLQEKSLRIRAKKVRQALGAMDRVEVIVADAARQRRK